MRFGALPGPASPDTERLLSLRPPGLPPVTSQSRDFWPVLAAATGSTMVGSVPMLAMGLYSRGMDPQSMLFWRYWLALSILVPLAVATSPGLASEWRSAGRGLFINGITLGVLQTFTYFRAIQTMPSSIVVTIFFTYPLFTVLIDHFLFGRKARLPTVLAVFLILIGVALTGWPHLTLHEVEPVGLACAILTPLIFSVYIAIAFRFTRQSSPFAGATFIYLGSAAASRSSSWRSASRCPATGAAGRASLPSPRSAAPCRYPPSHTHCRACRPADTRSSSVSSS